ncbi:ATP-binding protein [Thermococcus sp. GR6]|uniref:ATP-binding protein n=1 Tax=Thermococcus sp. GR6 TaxID=1638256 RepID=UPI001430F779|nr:ATP-binding protein [Thermococcus sp. GR6]NJE42790.1 ATP-binding protein [Thermococcus sp. GR6]
MKKIGNIVEVTSTLSFKFVITDKEAEKENLVFSYVEVPLDEDEKIVGRILDVKKENPLLSIEQAGALAKELIEGIGVSFPPERYTYAIAECEVVGLLKGDKIEQNRKPVPPGKEVYPLSTDSLRILFYKKSPEFIPIGKIESFGSTEKIPITVNGDELVTKHFAVFGMTGSGKTNTAAKIIEELAMRGYRIIIFDPHGDYYSATNANRTVVNFEGVFEINPDKKREMLAFLESEGLSIRPEELTPLLQTLSVLLNQPIWYVITNFRDIINKIKYNLDDIKKSDLFEFQKKLKENIRQHIIFPELKYYGEGFEDFTLKLMEGFLGERFSDAQRRYLYDFIKPKDDKERNETDRKGEAFIEDLIKKTRRIEHDATRRALDGKLRRLKNAYRDLKKMADPSEVDKLSVDIFMGNTPERIHVFSLYSLPEKMRKVVVFAIVEYIFRAYKFGIYNEDTKETIRIPEKSRYPLLFILEEARSLIPAHASPERDYAGWLAVSSLRDLAYEGRKFKLSYGIISQKPSTVDVEVVSQCNTLILHQLKNPDDQEYVKKVTEGLTKIEIEMLKNIGTGKAVLTGAAINSTILMEVFRRYSLEGIVRPTPLSDVLYDLKIDELKKQLRL